MISSLPAPRPECYILNSPTNMELKPSIYFVYNRGFCVVWGVYCLLSRLTYSQGLNLVGIIVKYCNNKDSTPRIHQSVL